jgi:hypothetical protein
MLLIDGWLLCWYQCKSTWKETKNQWKYTYFTHKYPIYPYNTLILPWNVRKAQEAIQKRIFQLEETLPLDFFPSKFFYILMNTYSIISQSFMGIGEQKYFWLFGTAPPICSIHISMIVISLRILIPILFYGIIYGDVCDVCSWVVCHISSCASTICTSQSHVRSLLLDFP